MTALRVTDEDFKKEYHYILCDIVKKFGKSKRKLNGHGKDWIYKISINEYVTLDDYNYSLVYYKNNKRFYVGLIFGGYSTNIELNDYFKLYKILTARPFVSNTK